MAEPQPNVAFAWTQASAGVGPALECRPLGAVARHLFTAHHLALRGNPARGRRLPPRWVGSSVIRLVSQVHRDGVAVARGRDTEWNPPEADIILTDDPDLVIAVRIADCAPVLIADPGDGRWAPCTRDGGERFKALLAPVSAP